MKPFFLICALLFFPVFVVAQTNESFEEPEIQEDQFFRGKVIAVVSEETKQEYSFLTFVQELSVYLENGPEEGMVVAVFNEIDITEDDTAKNDRRMHVGNRLVVGKSVIGGEVLYYVSDMYRLHTLWFGIGLFLLLAVVLAKRGGLRAILGLAVSFLVIIFFIVPSIVAGRDPFFISLIGTIIIAFFSLYLAHGWYARTSIAFVSTMITISVSLGLATLFVRFGHLFGLGSEEAFFLQFAPTASINIQGLLLGGIIIGALGVLDDITTAQAATVEQIHETDPALSFRELYAKGSAVGREHIISLVNTLVLAYTGASLPLLLLFQIYERPAWVVLNSEIVMEELIRMLVGSIALLLAVPLTTFLAARYFSRKLTMMK